MRKTKIIVMGTGQGMGGLHTHLLCLVRFLVREGHEVVQFVVADPGMPFAGSHAGGRILRVRHRAGTLGEKWRKFLDLRRMKREVRSFRPDLFIATAPGRGYAQIARHARKCGAFTVWQAVTLAAPKDPLHTEMSQSVDAVAVQTPGMLAPFRQAIAVTAAVGCLPCFFEPPACKRVPLPLPPGDPVRLGYFGRLAGNKGLVPFLHAFREVANRRAVRLDIHGEGPERVALEKTIGELGLANLVSLKGRYPDGAEYGRLLEECHAIVLPSIDCEGLPLVLLEAMSCGVPVLATRIGGIGDIAAGNPDVVVVEPTTGALISGLRRLVEMIGAGEISHSRLASYYQHHFSVVQMERVWRAMVSDARRFFAPQNENLA